MLRLIIVFLFLTTLVSSSSPPNNSSNSLLESESFLYSTLDDWILRINRTLSSPDLEQVSGQCHGHLTILLKSAKSRQPWALKMFDSIGKPGSGIMEASLSFLGFYSECLESKAPLGLSETASVNALKMETLNKEYLFEGKYCMANMQLSSRVIKVLQKLSGLSASVLVSSQPRIGLCIPSTCSHEDIELVADHVLKSYLPKSRLTITTCSEPKKHLSEDVAGLSVLSVFAVILIPVVIGSVIDYIENYSSSAEKVKEDAKSMRLRAYTVTSVMSLTSTSSDPSVLLKKRSNCVRIKDFLRCFSMIENGRRILGIKKHNCSVENNNNNVCKRSSNDIDVLHGMRVLMMIWIISGHTYSFAMQWLFFRNPKELQAAPQNILSQVFVNGTFSVDSFFFISGLLVTFVGLRHMSRRNGNFNIGKFYLHRYLRMTPLMMAVIAFTATLLKYMNEGPAATESTVMFDLWCRKNWWTNALYLHNFINRENMCLSHSWYSAVDMQLFIVTPLILIPLYRRPRIGLFIILGTLLSSMLLTASLTILNHLPAVPYMSDVVSQDVMNEYYGMIYIKPYTRIGPYLVGMALGFVLYSREGKITLSKNQSIIGWTAAVIANVAVLFAMLPVNGGYRLPDVLAGLYSATSRVIWALSLAWVTYATSAGKGGWIGSFLSSKFWQPWSRLTYSAYLIHPVIMAIFYGSRQTTFEFSHFLMSYIALGNLILTYAVSFLLSIVFESPVISIEKLLTHTRRRSGSNTRVLSSSC